LDSVYTVSNLSSYKKHENINPICDITDMTHGMKNLLCSLINPEDNVLRHLKRIQVSVLNRISCVFKPPVFFIINMHTKTNKELDAVCTKKTITPFT